MTRTEPFLRMKKASCAILCAALLFLCLFSVKAETDPSSSALYDEIVAVFDARKAHSGGVKTLLTSPDFLSKTGEANSSTFTDWIALAMGRFSFVNAKGEPRFLYADGQTEYLDGLSVYVSKSYEKNGGLLSKSKVTEGQRCALTVAALGGDSRSIGTFEGRSVDLVADSTFDSKLPVTRQGIMGVIFALIAKNACGAKTPQAAAYNDEFLYTYLLEWELPKGGWTLMGKMADADVTAMALCALALAKDDAAVYTVERAADEKTVSSTLGAAAERGLACLSRMQMPDGGYGSGGVRNCESCAQVLTALSAFGIDAETDPRFLKKGNSVLDAMLSYRLADGSFAHTKNENGKAETFNVLATDQAAYALVARWRCVSGMRSLYDMRPDLSAPMQTLLRDLVRYLLAVFSFLTTGTKISVSSPR